MLRRHHRIFQTSLLLRDLAVLVCAFVLAHALRAKWPLLWWHGQAPAINTEDTIDVALTLLLLWPWMGWMANLYISRRTQRAITECLDVAKAVALTFICGVTLTYFTRESRYSRGALVLWAQVSFVLLAAVRLGQKWLLARLRRAGRNLRHVLIVGAGPHAHKVVRTIEQDSGLGLRIRGLLTPSPKVQPLIQAPMGTAMVPPGVPHLGSVSDLHRVLEQHDIDQVLVALPIEDMADLPLLMEQLSRHTVDVRLVPDLYEVMTLCGRLEDFCGLPMIALQASPLVGLQSLGKRLFDLVFASVALALLWPVLAAISLTILWQNEGPILYRQSRVGLDGCRFKMLKFRTMRVAQGPQMAKMTEINDPRRTSLGAFLRRTSLDELPQLFNVLAGDMSLVGPRPEQPSFTKTFVTEIPRYALRHKIKAGMTGWAQINGLRGNTSIKKRIELDLYYIENWSVALDFKILVRTVLGGFISPHAY